MLDAKSSLQDLGAHEQQIRTYIDQRHLDFGVLFNLRELRVYRLGRRGHDPELSFDIRRLWEVARGEALAMEEVVPDVLTERVIASAVSRAGAAGADDA